MDLAALGIRIDSSQAKVAVGDLDKLADAGGRAEKAVEGVGKAGATAAKGVGDTGKAASSATKSIDDYVKKLQLTAATNGMGAREAKLYELALGGASKAQLQAADSAIRMNEGYERGIEIGNRVRVGFIALAAAAATAATATVAATISLISQAGAYKDVAEKIGDTSAAVSSFKEASDVSGVAINTVAAASIRLTAALSKTDDESKLVAKGLKSIGLELQSFKAQSPVEQLESVAQALAKYADGAEKTAVAQALFGRSGAELIPFLNEYAEKGRQAAFITKEQGDAADEFSDAQARLRSEFEQFLQLQAVGAIPVLTQISNLFRSIATDTTANAVATDLLRGAIGLAVTVFQGLVIVATDVGFTFQAVGREIGAVAAQLVALANLDFNGFSAISDAVTEDAARARKELDKFQAKVMAIGQESAKFADPRILGNPGTIAEQAAALRPKINTRNLNTDRAPRQKKDNSAAQEAKAQLAFDLQEIRKAQDALSNTIANGEKVLDARRAANLISESEYYAKKRGFLQENDRVQQEALQKEIERLEQEKLAGKEKIDNDRKIADAQAKLAKLRENAATNVEVLGIREQAALKKIQDAFVEARNAAQSYLDVTNRARQLELDSIGKGTKARDLNAAKSQIEERYEAQRQSLAGEFRRGDITKEQFDEQLSLINEFQAKSVSSYLDYYTKLTDAQLDWTNGAKEALQNYYDESQDIAGQTQRLFTDAFKGIEDALVEFVKTGKLDFKSLVDSIIADIARIVIKEQITGPLAKLLGGALGGGSSGGGTDIFSSLIGLFGGGRAIGGDVSRGKLYEVNERGGPGELLNIAGKQYLMPTQNGKVETNAGRDGGAINYSPTFILNEPASRKTQDQLARVAGQGLRRTERNT